MDGTVRPVFRRPILPSRIPRQGPDSFSAAALHTARPRPAGLPAAPQTVPAP